ncbi:hypothetical protein DFH08DRAFT_980144 [Mycena albidolilacea]|uniref:Uncharacterized protein n=1 Tax=Mycena albidolilacea TaxID=1033008 RepID=A0AAD7AT57_9AGAR|nr:hypothetical protein DFH08DRAFT_980144 [Mycena albidolilacea]
MLHPASHSSTPRRVLETDLCNIEVEHSTIPQFKIALTTLLPPSPLRAASSAQSIADAGSGRAWSPLLPLHTNYIGAVARHYIKREPGTQRRILLLGSDDGLSLRRMIVSDGTTHLNRVPWAVGPASSYCPCFVAPALHITRSSTSTNAPFTPRLLASVLKPCTGRAVEKTTTALALDPSDPPSFVSILRNPAVPFDLQSPHPNLYVSRRPSYTAEGRWSRRAPLAGGCRMLPTSLCGCLESEE